MSIQEIASEEVVQLCAFCGAENRIGLGALCAGVTVGGMTDPHVIALPACLCGAQEFVVRSPDKEPPHPIPGSRGHLHRLLVDHLHAELVARECSLPECGSLSPRRIDPAERERWFATGLLVPR